MSNLSPILGIVEYLTLIRDGLKKKDYNNMMNLMCLGWPREAST